MDKSANDKALLDLIREHYYSAAKRPGKVTMDSTMQQLGADDLDLVEMAMAAEDRFGVDIPDNIVSPSLTPRALMEYIKAVKAAEEWKKRKYPVKSANMSALEKAAESSLIKAAEAGENPPIPLYHVSANPYLKVLNPRVPDNFFTRNGYEDAKTPRVSLAPSIEDCLAALSQGGMEGKELIVYKANPENLTLKEPTVQEVPDAKVTKEIWSLSPVTLELLKKIKIIKPGGARKFRYGDTDTETYTWKYTDVDPSIEKKSNTSADYYKAMHWEPGPALLGEYGHNVGKAFHMPRREWESDDEYTVRRWKGIIKALQGKRVDVSAPRVTIKP